MILWTIQVAIISFILIFLVHYIWLFFIDMLTVPKTYDLVEIKQQHQKLLDSAPQKLSFDSAPLAPQKLTQHNTASTTPISGATPISSNLLDEDAAHKEELKRYLQNY